MAGQSLLVSLLGGIALLLWSTRLVRAKDDVRAVERAATESHLRWLREGAVAAMETASLLLGILRDHKRIIAHLTDVAYSILEADPRGIGRTQGLAAGTEPAGASTRHVLAGC